MDQNHILADIRERIVRVETKLDAMTDLKETADDARAVAYEALASTQSAHKRLDMIVKIIFWAGTTIFGAIVAAIIKFYTHGGME